MGPTVTRNDELHRYEIRVDGELAGFTEYKPLSSQLAFVHTETDPKFGGQGLGSILVGAALDDVRSQGIGVLPFCPFVHGFIDKHPEYLDLVPSWARARFGFPLVEESTD
jgi:predicted GNAT family acetyltransferase